VLSSPVRRGTPFLAFAAGLAVGGVITAAVLVVVGSLVRAPLPDAARWGVLGGVLGAVVLRELDVLSFTLPENRRLVPETVLRFGRHLGPLQFGLEMGTGARTFLPSGLPYVGAVAVLLIASVPAAICTGAGFGLGRAMMTMSNLRYGPDNLWSDEWDRHGNRLGRMMGAAVVLPLLVLAVPTFSRWL
jgi:hypothetical protein